MFESYITTEEVKEFLRIDNDYSDSIIEGLLQGAYQYIEQGTGISYEEQQGIPLAKTLALFICRLFYYPENLEAYRLRQVIDNLMMSIKDYTK